MFRRLKFILLSLMALTLFSCKSIDIIPEVELPNNDKISFLVWSIETKSDRFEVKVVFSEDTEYEGLIQEIVLDDGTVLVEYFLLPFGKFSAGSYDFHAATFIMTKHLRNMRIYPANVTGVDYDNGFAHLPQNIDGSLKTNIGPFFNPEYQKDHKTQGRITKADRDNSIYWSIIFNDGIIIVVLPDNTKIKIGNTIK